MQLRALRRLYRRLRDFGVVSESHRRPTSSCHKEKYGNSLVIGGWDVVGELTADDVSEETVKESVYAAIDKYAPGGGYAFCGGFLGPLDDEKTQRKNRWIAEAVASYGATFYKK